MHFPSKKRAKVRLFSELPKEKQKNITKKTTGASESRAIPEYIENIERYAIIE